MLTLLKRTFNPVDCPFCTSDVYITITGSRLISLPPQAHIYFHIVFSYTRVRFKIRQGWKWQGEMKVMVLLVIVRVSCWEFGLLFLDVYILKIRYMWMVVLMYLSSLSLLKFTNTLLKSVCPLNLNVAVITDSWFSIHHCIFSFSILTCQKVMISINLLLLHENYIAVFCGSTTHSSPLGGGLTTSLNFSNPRLVRLGKVWFWLSSIQDSRNI